jgi:hypothetical protein
LTLQSAPNLQPNAPDYRRRWLHPQPRRAIQPVVYRPTRDHVVATPKPVYSLRSRGLILPEDHDLIRVPRRRLQQPFDFDAVKPLLGRVVGSVDIVDCVTKSKSPWYGGEYGFVLRNPVLLKPFNVDVREKDLKRR